MSIGFIYNAKILGTGNFEYISLQEAAKYSERYSQEYLSLRARQGKLKAIKIGRNWVTTRVWVDDYKRQAYAVKLIRDIV